jgi:hypothetical protein
MYFNICEADSSCACRLHGGHPAIASTVTATSVYSRPSNSSSSTLSSTVHAPLNLQQRHAAAADCERWWDQWTPCQAASRAWDVRVFSQHMAARRRRAGGAVLHGVIDVNSENVAKLGQPGPSPSSLCEKGTRAVNRCGVSIYHLSPKIRVSTVFPEAGKEASHVAVSSLRKLSSGGHRYPDRCPSELV